MHIVYIYNNIYFHGTRIAHRHDMYCVMDIHTAALLFTHHLKVINLRLAWFAISKFHILTWKLGWFFFLVFGCSISRETKISIRNNDFHIVHKKKIGWFHQHKKKRLYFEYLGPTIEKKMPRHFRCTFNSICICLKNYKTTKCVVNAILWFLLLLNLCTM